MQAMERRLEQFSARVEQAGRALALLSPLEKLRLQTERLDSLQRRMESTLTAHIEHEAQLLERLALRLENAGEHRLRMVEQALERASSPLNQLGRMVGLAQEHELSRLELKLRTLDPYEPLKRGYAMALVEDCTFLRSVEQAVPGQKVIVELSDGRLVTVVSEVERKGADA
jgi:exodeoxyribonuclease VII large subunit